MSYQITEPLPSVPATNYIHGGRGGAGNYRRVDPSKRVSTTVTASSRPASLDGTKSNAVYSCGRGGAGNMYAGSERAIFSFDEELTRERVREEVAAPVYHVGRGGAGNFAKRESGDDGSARSSNESIRSGIEQIWGKISGTFSRA